MQPIEHIAAYIGGHGIPATSGMMPIVPDRVATVYATGARPRGDDEGTRFQVVVRSLPERDTALSDAMMIAELLDDFCGITGIDSPYFAQIQLESGVTALGADENRRLMYSVNFRAWIC